MPPRKAAGTVEKAVRSELRTLGCSLQKDGSAALAVSLAKQIDTSRGAVAAAAAAAQLRLLLADLRSSAAERPGEDAIDELNGQSAVLRVVPG
jgi:hypothetical protein